MIDLRDAVRDIYCQRQLSVTAQWRKAESLPSTKAIREGLHVVSKAAF
jgi:hypothetical protein